MKDYAVFETEDRRLMLLRILLGLEDRRANQHVLRAALRGEGHHELPATVLNDIAFLRGEGLVEKEDLGRGIVLVTLTELGELTAMGRKRMAGVAVPSE
jgi:hypothetical protein